MKTETRDAILHLRTHGYTISGIYAITGVSITEICEVIYEQNQKDISNDGTASGNWDGIF